MTAKTQDMHGNAARRDQSPRLLAAVKLNRWWKPKAANLLAVLYSVILITKLPVFRAFSLMFPSIITILGIGSFGHLVNDWYDIEADRTAGKVNHLEKMPVWKRRTFILGALAAGLAPWTILPFDTLSVILLLVEIGLLIAYAAPPVRLKEKQTWPLFADGAYAYAIPAVLAAHTFFLAAARPLSWFLLGLLIVWQLALGVRHFMNHLALDRGNDLRSGIVTLATRRGNRFLHIRIRHWVLPVELSAFFAYLWVAGRSATYLTLVVCVIFAASLFMPAMLAIFRRYPLLTYRFSFAPADRLYQEIFPLVLLLYLVRSDLRFAGLLIAHIVLFYLLTPVLGAVYLLARYAGIAPPVASARTSPPMAAGDPESIRRHPRNAAWPNIAVVNINQAKYTETFIQGLIPRLHYNVYYLFGSELPRFDSDGRYFLSRRTSMHVLAYSLEQLFHLDRDHFLKNSIASYLQAKRIQLVLAEFGPVGIEMLPIARDMGVPLIVCFHGYDAFHQETLRQCRAGYEDLFQQSQRLVCVSERMMRSLRELGAPPDKLVHLPAFVQLEMFPYSDHGAIGPRFLAVGRFAETKSPHLTILAFHRVAQVMPHATLTMVGKGGGGELFEACLILVKSLGLEDRVNLPGVLAHSEVAAEMRRARVFVQHSVTTPVNCDMEGKPVAVMEAMSSGLPVVATRHSGIDELIEHNVTGLLAPEYDVPAMADAMLRLAQDDDLVRTLGWNASRFINRHPLISRHVEILEQIIDGAIRGAGS